MTARTRQARLGEAQGKAAPIVLDKQWRVVPRGVALVIGCADLPDLEQLSRPVREPGHRQQR